MRALVDQSFVCNFTPMVRSCTSEISSFFTYIEVLNLLWGSIRQFSGQTCLKLHFHNHICPNCKMVSIENYSGVYLQLTNVQLFTNFTVAILCTVNVQKFQTFKITNTLKEVQNLDVGKEPKNLTWTWWLPLKLWIGLIWYTGIISFRQHKHIWFCR